MTYYWCFNCNTAVSEDEIDCKEGYTSIDGHSYRNTYEDEYFCPNCGEEFNELEEAKECPICGEYMNPDRFICEDCEEEMRVYIEQMIDGFAFDKDMTKEEAIEIFNLYLEQTGASIL